MKLTKITSMMAAATAVGFCMSASATGEGRSGKLELDNPVTKVNVTTSSATGGSWNNPAPATESSYFVIDCDAATSNQFNATSVTTGKVVKCTFTLQAAPVPMPLSVPDNNTQVAFCIATNTTSGGAARFQAYVNNVWTNLTGATIPATESEYTLTITFDYSESTTYAKFTIGNTDLTASEVSWFPTSKSGSTGVQQYCFIGEGNLKSFLTTDQNIKAEEETITIGGNTVTIGIPEEVVQTIGGGNSSTAAAALAVNGSNGQLQLDNYVIYGLDGEGNIKQEAKPVAKADAATTGGGIKLNFENVAANQVTGTTIKYTLLGKTNSSAGNWNTVVGPTTDKDAMVIPSDTSYRIFKVEVTVEKGNN